MAQTGKVTKTEIFCLVLTAAFVLLAAVLFFQSGHGESGGWSISTGKRTDVSGTLPDKIDINSADAEQLQQLPGVGPVLAQRIIAWREENGSYLIPEDLLAVEGIGLATLEGLRDMIVIKEEP